MQDQEAHRISKLRRPDLKERAAVLEELARNGSPVLPTYPMLIHDLRYKELLIYPPTSSKVEGLSVQLSRLHNVYFSGLYGGSFRGQKFHVSMDFAEYLYLGGHWTSVLKVDEVDERAFLYGRDISLPSSALEARRTYLVLGPSADVLGLARVDPKRMRLLNLIDKGWYLRRGH